MRTGATFRLWVAEGMTAQTVSMRLGLEPGSSPEDGSDGASGAAVRLEGSTWLLSTNISDDTDLERQLNDLLDLLEPRAAVLHALVADGCVANWFCYLGSHAAEHAAELPSSLLRRLVSLPGDLWLDVYGDGHDEE